MKSDTSQLQQDSVNMSFINKHQLPLVVTPINKGIILSDWLLENESLLNSKLLEYGAVLFRGFEIDSLEKFQEFIATFKSKPLPYMFRSSPRTEINQKIKNVYHSTTYPSNQTINQHNESSYSRVWGMKIIFCCLTKPISGGETPLADSRKVLSDIPAPLIEKFKKSGIKYVRNLFTQIGLSWKEVFQTENKDDMMNICKKYEIKCSFIDDENVTISWTKPAIYQHPTSKENIWFNHSLLFNKYSIYEILGLSAEDELPEDVVTQNTLFGNNTELSYEEYQSIKNAYIKNKVEFPYEKGDVLVLDNMLVSHGRNPFKGDRLIATSIIEPYFDDGYSDI